MYDVGQPRSSRPTIKQYFFVITCIFSEASGYLVPHITRFDGACLVEKMLILDSTYDKI